MAFELPDGAAKRPQQRVASCKPSLFACRMCNLHVRSGHHPRAPPGLGPTSSSASLRLQDGTTGEGPGNGMVAHMGKVMVAWATCTCILREGRLCMQDDCLKARQGRPHGIAPAVGLVTVQRCQFTTCCGTKHISGLLHVNKSLLRLRVPADLLKLQTRVVCRTTCARGNKSTGPVQTVKP
jgi:hypothetical protein